MYYTTDDPAERERRRWIKPNAYLWVRPDIHRFMRPDADRFFHPSHRGQKRWYEQPEYMSPAMRAYSEKPAWARGRDDAIMRADAAAAEAEWRAFTEELEWRARAEEAERQAFEIELERLRRNNNALQALLHEQRDALTRRQRALKAGFDPNQPRVPAGHPDGGQWADAGGSSVGDGSADSGRRLPYSQATVSRSPLKPATRVRLADAGTLTNPGVLSDAMPGLDVAPDPASPKRIGPRAAATPADVVLPDGSKIPDDRSPTGFMLSPVADLSPVAEAGRKAGETFRALLAMPDAFTEALVYLAFAMGRDLSQGGAFDYQREADSAGGYAQLRHYRNVSNFNVGLYSQQAGFSLHNALTIAGLYARFRSSNARPDLPYGLDSDTRRYTEYGYEVGQRRLFSGVK